MLSESAAKCAAHWGRIVPIPPDLVKVIHAWPDLPQASTSPTRGLHCHMFQPRQSKIGRVKCQHSGRVASTVGRTQKSWYNGRVAHVSSLPRRRNVCRDGSLGHGVAARPRRCFGSVPRPRGRASLPGPGSADRGLRNSPAGSDEGQRARLARYDFVWSVRGPYYYALAGLVTFLIVFRTYRIIRWLRRRRRAVPSAGRAVSGGDTRDDKEP